MTLIDCLKATQGSFWRLQSQLRRGGDQPLWGVCCSEVGVELDRLLMPASPQFVTQNAGAQCDDLLCFAHLTREVPGDLVLVSHEGCRFSSCSCQDALLENFRKIFCDSVLRHHLISRALRVHLWSLSPTQGLRVYDSTRKELVSPIQLIPVCSGQYR